VPSQPGSPFLEGLSREAGQVSGSGEACLDHAFGGSRGARQGPFGPISASASAGPQVPGA